VGYLVVESLCTGAPFQRALAITGPGLGTSAASDSTSERLVSIILSPLGKHMVTSYLRKRV